MHAYHEIFLGEKNRWWDTIREGLQLETTWYLAFKTHGCRSMKKSTYRL